MKSRDLGIVIAMIVMNVLPYGRCAYPNEGWASSTWIQTQNTNLPYPARAGRTTVPSYDGCVGAASLYVSQPYYSYDYIPRLWGPIRPREGGANFRVAGFCTEATSELLYQSHSSHDYHQKAKIAIRSCEAKNDPNTLCRTYACGNHGFLHLHKTMPQHVRYNRPFEYCIRILNRTNIAVTDVVVKEHWSTHVQVLRSSPCTMMKNDTLIWELDTMKPMSEKTIYVKAKATEDNPIQSCATLSFQTPACQQIEVVKPNLVLMLDIPNQAGLCDAIPLKLFVKNTGISSAEEIVISDILPPGLQTQKGQNQLMVDVGTLAPNQSREFVITLNALRTGAYTITATAVTADELQVRSIPVNITIRQPALALHMSEPANHYLGHPAKYIITVTNTGDMLAQNIAMEGTIDSGMRLVGASHPGRVEKDKVIWVLPALEPRQSHVVEMILWPEQEGIFTSRATVRADCVSPVTTSMKTSIWGIAAILLELVDVEDPIELGNNVTYTVTATNQGTTADTNVHITCILEDTAEYVLSSGATSATVRGNSVNFTPLASLAPKTTATWRVVAKAVKPGDTRFKVSMTSDQLTRPVEETESTEFYE
jgi:uncharacterized repeat protein (TIGR01451 family)